MSQRQRGQEVTIRVAIDGVQQGGSFLKVTDWEAVQRADLVEEGYAGELEDDIDYQFHGWDLSFSIHNQDQKSLQVMQSIIDREQNAERHPNITITVLHGYRAGLGTNQIEVFHRVYLKPGAHGFSGRKDYVKTAFEGKCKKRSLVTA